MKTIGMIGGGKMGGAILDALLADGFAPEALSVSDRSEEALARYEAKGLFTCKDNNRVVARSELVFLAVKPQVMPQVLSEIRQEAEGKIIVTIAAGIQVDTVAGALSGAKGVIRIMPNTPMLLGKGTIALCRGTATEEICQAVTGLLSGAGNVYRVEEEKMDGVTALSGSGPAYFYRIALRLAEAAAETGLPRDTAIRMAAATMAGAAEMLLKSGHTPEQLIKDVSSPNGTTVAALEAFDRTGLDASLAAGVRAAYLRSKELASGN